MRRNAAASLPISVLSYTLLYTACFLSLFQGNTHAQLLVRLPSDHFSGRPTSAYFCIGLFKPFNTRLRRILSFPRSRFLAHPFRAPWH